MEPRHYPNDLVRESVILPGDHRKASLSPDPTEGIETRKASIISRHDGEISTNRPSKGRLSLTQNYRDLVEVETASSKLKSNVKPNNTHRRSIVEKSQVANKGQVVGATSCSTQPKFEENNEAINLPEDTHTEEAKPKYVTLEDKLADDHELDIIGILNLSSMNLTDYDVPVIIQRALWEQKKCIGIILRDNALTAIGVKMLVDELLMAKTKLQYLGLSNNIGITDTGIEHLARLLKESRSMTFLSLLNTGITNRGVRMLADVLCGVDPDASRPPLEKLYISFNKAITDESMEALLEILEKNETLKILCLQNCGLSDRARRRLRHMAAKKKKRKFSLTE